MTGQYLFTLAMALLLCIVPGLSQSAPHPEAPDSALSIRFGVYPGFIQMFPDHNGIGYLYNVAAEVFAKKGYTVSAREYPPKRLPLSLLNDELDLFASSDRINSEAQTGILRSELPASVVTFYIYHNSQTLNLQWPPDEQFKKSIGKSYISAESLRSDWGLTISASATVDAIVQMIHNQRADYWLDTQAATRSLAAGQLHNGERGFIYRPLFVRPMYIYFQDSVEGRLQLKIYNSGFLDILRQGEFHKIYHHNNTHPGFSDTVEQTLIYIRKHFPDHKIPVTSSLE